MFDYPSPTELTQLLDLENVSARRSLFCSHYDDCLDKALERRWHSWSCEECELFSVRREMVAAFAKSFEGARDADAAIH